MISDFQELSDKIDQLAELTKSLRRENMQLRQVNVTLMVENIHLKRRQAEAHQRVSNLLDQIPAADSAPAPEQEAAQ